MSPFIFLGQQAPGQPHFRRSPSHSLPRGAISFNVSLPSLTAAIELNSPRSVSSQFGTSGYHIPPAMNRIIVRWVNDPLDANPSEVRPPLSLSIPHVVGTGLELLGMNYNCGPLSHPAFFNPSSTSETELIDFDDSIIPVSSIGTTSDPHIESMRLSAISNRFIRHAAFSCSTAT